MKTGLLTDSNHFSEKKEILTGDFTQAELLVFILSCLSFFIHPYFVLITAAIVQVYARIRPISFLPIFLFSLALYWSLRVYGFTWSTGVDDAGGYFQLFYDMHYKSLSDLFQDYLNLSPASELGYSFFVYVLRLFTSNDRVFLFSIYLLMLVLLAYGSIQLSRRYYLVIIVLLFMGFGMFLTHNAMHYFRSTLAYLMIFVGISIFESNRKRGYFFLVLSALFHNSAIPLILMIFLTEKLKFVTSYTKLFIYSIFIIFLIFLLGIFMPGDIYLFLLNISRENYISDSSELVISFKTLFTIVVLFLFVIIEKEKDRYPFKIFWFMTMFITLFFVFMQEYKVITGRYLTISEIFFSVLFFQLLMKIRSKGIIATILLFIFIRKFFILSVSEYYQLAFPDFSNFFSSLFFKLFSS